MFLVTEKGHIRPDVRGHFIEGNIMKYVRVASSVLVLAGLAACSTPQPKAQTPEPLAASVTQFGHSELNEAASAYVSLYKQTIERSLSERKYKEDLAYKHLSAEACFDSRTSRLIDKRLTQQEKDELVMTWVSPDKLQAYQGLSKGYVTRINGLEFLTCDLAGLKVGHKDMRY